MSSDIHARQIVQGLLGGDYFGYDGEIFQPERALHLPAALDPGLVFSLEEVESLLHMPAFFAEVRVLIREPGQHQTRQAQIPDQVVEALTDGHSVHMAELHKVLPAAHPLMLRLRAIEAVLGAQARGITAFIASKGESIPIHHDVYEVFTLQIEGRKTWSLYDFTPPATPVRDYGERPLDETVTLAPGDALYMPKGQIHHVVTDEGPSLSLALVFQADDWILLLNRLAEQLSDDRLFWRSLPAQGIADGVEARREALISALRALDAKAIADRVQQARVEDFPGVPKPVLRGRLPDNQKA